MPLADQLDRLFDADPDPACEAKLSVVVDRDSLLSLIAASLVELAGPAAARHAEQLLSAAELHGDVRCRADGRYAVVNPLCAERMAVAVGFAFSHLDVAASLPGQH